MNLDTERSVDGQTAPGPPAESNTLCCPRFDPAPWRDKELHWGDKPFIKRRVHSILHVPLHLERAFAEEQELIAKAQAGTPENIVLTDENSLWGADYYFAVSKEVPTAEMVRLSGTFFTHVFEGPYSKARKWMEAMQHLAAERGEDIEKLYCWYTTCPKCAKAYGENYVVLFAKVAD